LPILQVCLAITIRDDDEFEIQPLYAGALMSIDHSMTGDCGTESMWETLPPHALDPPQQETEEIRTDA